jgi:hypothetical protein
MTDYFVNQVDGDDGADGLTTGTAWKTVDKVNSSTFAAGDTIKFNRGNIWRESLNQPANGVNGNPVKIDAYGTGDKPSFRGSDTANVGGSWTQETALYYLSSITADPEVFVHDGALGVRRTSKGALANQWDYWWDDPNDRLYVHSTANPTTLATLLEYGVRNRILGYAQNPYVRYDNIDIRHNRGDVTCGLFQAGTLEFYDCDISQLGQYFCQFNAGSGGTAQRCTATDWGSSQAVAYVFQSIAGSGTAGPLDVTDCTFTINHSNNANEITAVICDERGWVRTISRNTFVNNGVWPRDPISVYRPGADATTMTIEDNVITNAGGIAIAFQDLSVYSPTLLINCRRNLMTNSCTFDAADVQAFRVRSMASGITLNVYSNIINGTFDGAQNHEGMQIQAVTSGSLLIAHNVIYGVDQAVRWVGSSGSQAVFLLDNNIALNCRNNGLIIDNGGAVTFANRATNCISNNVTNFSGLAAASGDITTDPVFFSPGVNFHLQATSPCRGAGTVVSRVSGDFVNTGFRTPPPMGAFASLDEPFGFVFGVMR